MNYPSIIHQLKFGFLRQLLLLPLQQKLFHESYSQGMYDYWKILGICQHTMSQFFPTVMAEKNSVILMNYPLTFHLSRASIENTRLRS
jgi:hypothetical protein